MDNFGLYVPFEFILVLEKLLPGTKRLLKLSVELKLFYIISRRRQGSGQVRRGGAGAGVGGVCVGGGGGSVGGAV